jgi:hypothetical protein
MDLRSAAQTIRDTVTMYQILDLYGYKTKHGFMICPFHGDRDASLKVYDGARGWCCFGCGRKGSVIDFVMEHENCNFQTAVRAIDSALHLGLMDLKEDPFDAERNRDFQLSLDQFVESIYSCCKVQELMINNQLIADMKKYKTIRDKDVKDKTVDDWTFLHTFSDETEYNEYRLDKIKEFREEVAAWRRKARRVKI